MNRAKFVFYKLSEKKKNKPFIGTLDAGLVGAAAGGFVGSKVGPMVSKTHTWIIDPAKSLKSFKKARGWGAILGAIPAGLLAFKIQKDSYK